MTLDKAIRAAIIGRTFAFRRDYWQEGQHVTIDTWHGNLVPVMTFHRFADSVITWPWSPYPDDVLSADYTVVVVMPNHTLIKKEL